MALTVVESKPRGFSGLPRIAELTPKRIGLYATEGSVATLSAGNPLSTVLNFTEKGVISSLWLQGTGAENSVLVPRVIITIDDEVKYDGTNYIYLYRSEFFIGGVLPFKTGSVSDTSMASISSGFYEFDSLKVEIDTTGIANGISVFTDAQRIK